MRKKLTRMLAYLLVSFFVLPGYLLASILITKTPTAQAATIVGGGGNIVGGIVSNVGLNPISIISGEDGDIDSTGVTIEISQNTTSKVEFDTISPIVVAPSPNLDLGPGNGVSIILLASSDKITIPVVTASSTAGDFIVVAGVKVGATQAGYASSYAGTENLIIKSAGGTIEGSPIVVDTQYPSFSNIIATPQYINSGDVNISFTASEPLMSDPDVLVNGNMATFVSASGQDYQYKYTATGADTEGQATINIFGADVNFNADFAGFANIGALFIDRTNPSDPANVVATASGNQIQVNWDASNDGVGSGVAGYNVYRSDDGFLSPVNSSLITTTDYADTLTANGTYGYKLEAVDMAGNTSAKSAESNQVDVTGVLPPTPTNVQASRTGDTLNVSWDAVSGVAGYIVTINDVSVDVGNVTSYTMELKSYGTYNVIVTSYYSVNDFGVNDTVGLNQAKDAAVAAGWRRTVTYSEVVKASAVSVAPEAAQAAETSTVSESSSSTEDTTGLQQEEQGQIKGEEEGTQTTEESINWTPWIILFVLIILAGAATGGYFYWFAGEEEVETVVKTKPEVEKKITPKAKIKTSSKKPRRW